MSYRIEIRDATGGVVDHVLANTKADVQSALKTLEEAYAATAAAAELTERRTKIRSRVGAAGKMVENYRVAELYNELKDKGFAATEAWIMANAVPDLIQLYSDLDPAKKTDYRGETI